jgi:hypothetical protein
VSQQSDAKQRALEFAAELSAGTLKAYERYAVEVVERFGFCPWARAARESGNVALRVVFSVDRDDFDESLRLLSELHGQAPDTGGTGAEVGGSAGAEVGGSADIALFIYPLLDLDRLGFEDYARRLRTRAEDGLRLAPGLGFGRLDAFAMAAFHPSASADLSHPDRLVPFVRRTPDPTLQLVRNSALSRINGLTQGTAFLDVSVLTADALKALQQPPPKAVRDRIAEQNLATVRDVGSAVVEAVLTDIAREREVAHQRLLARHGRRGPRRLDPG